MTEPHSPTGSPVRVLNRIGQHLCPASDGAELERRNPADTRQLVSTAPESTAADVADAVTAAVDAATSWRRTSPTRRAELLTAGPAPLTGGLEDEGAAKLHVTSTALRLRRDRPELFTTYAGVPASGDAAEHVLAFDRGGAITVATRLPLGLAARGGWGDTVLDLPTGRWRDVLTDRVSDGRLADLLGTYPVALLVREDD